MPLNIPQSFFSDIQGRDTAIIPVVIIGGWNNTPVNGNPAIYHRYTDWLRDSLIISTNSFSYLARQDSNDTFGQYDEAGKQSDL